MIKIGTVGIRAKTQPLPCNSSGLKSIRLIIDFLMTILGAYNFRIIAQGS